MDFKLSDDTKKYLRQEFSRRDKTRSGFINHKDFEECLAYLGINVKEEDIDYLKTHFDSNGDGKLSVQELVDNISVIHAHSLRREELMEAFAVFDVEKSGFIRLPHMLKILTANEFMPVLEARKLLEYLMQKYDKNHDGKFDYAEFVQMFMCENIFSDFGKQLNDETSPQ